MIQNNCKGNEVFLLDFLFPSLFVMYSTSHYHKTA